MTLPLHVVDSLDDVRVGSVVTLDGDEAHHAVSVRRLREHHDLTLTDGRGTTVTGVVVSTGHRTLSLAVRSVEAVAPPAPSVVLVQALPKRERGELAVEMLTEVGVARIVPWAAARCVRVWTGDRADRSLVRWRTTAREAAKQARRAWFPEVDELASTKDVVALLESAALGVVLHEAAEQRLGRLRVPAGDVDVVVVVGPEGGLTDEEVASFEAAGAVAARMGDEVLRTSTAGVAAVAALLSQTPRWR